MFDASTMAYSALVFHQRPNAQPKPRFRANQPVVVVAPIVDVPGEAQHLLAMAALCLLVAWRGDRPSRLPMRTTE